MLISNNTVDAAILKQIMEEMNRNLKKVLVPVGRLAVRMEIFDLDKEVGRVVSDYADIMNSTEVPMFKRSVIEDKTIEIKYPPIMYHFNSIPGAWNDLIARSFGPAHRADFFGIGQLPSVMQFRTQLAMKLEELVRQLPLIKEHKLSPAVIVDIQTEGAGTYSEKTETLVLEISVNLTQM